MKVFFDARMITHPGIGRYIRQLLSHFKGRGVSFTLLGYKDINSRHFKDKDYDTIEFDYKIYSLSEQLGFLKLKNKLKEGILHIPHYNIPYFLKHKRMVATIHDLTHIIYPQGASSRFAPYYMRTMIKKILNEANKVICVSNYTKKSLLEEFGAGCAGKIKVIYEAAADIFGYINDKGYLGKIKERYRLPDKFILYVGSIRRHKNVGNLIKAVKLLKKDIPDIFLVLVGRHSHRIKEIDEKFVVHLDSVGSDKELAAIYNLASIFCSLSFYEGFGLPFLEAQKCCLPVVCSSLPVAKEILNDSAIFVDPRDISQIVSSLRDVLVDTSFQDSLIKKGINNSAQFSWQKCAEETLATYQEIP